MKLYLMRHGEYVTNDLQAPLSKHGRDEVALIATFLKQSAIAPRKIIHSEKKRAQETAQIIANHLNGEDLIEMRKGIAPNDDVSAFAYQLVAGEQDVMVVGHLPFMSKLVGKLVVGDEHKQLMAFQTATIVCLEEIQVDRWIINWVITPNLLSNSLPNLV